MKKICSICLALVLLLAMLPKTAISAFAASSIIASGTALECGYDWSLTSDGILTISGTSYVDSSMDTWEEYRDEVRHLVFGDGVKYINCMTFADYTELKTITFPDSIREIQAEAFINCESLESVNLPEGLERIDDHAFAGCSSLRSLVLPDSLKYVGNSAFNGCYALLSVQISKGLTEIGQWFFGCESLRSVIIPEGVTVIGERAFEYCSSLSNIEIPSTVNKIERNAFGNSYFLRSIRFLGDAPVIYDGAFYCVEASVYYDATKNGWTEDVMQDYGGNLCWIPEGHQHTYVELPTIEATCTEDGRIYGEICSDCGAVGARSFVIPALGHEKVTDPRLEPTETTDGLTEGQHCGRCGEILVAQEVIPALGAKEITAQPLSVTVKSGETAKFTVEAKGAVSTYRWQYKKLSKWYDTALTGCDTDTLTVQSTGDRNGYEYRCVITFADGTKLISQPAKLTVHGEITNVQNPEDQTVPQGRKANFTVNATGDGLQYQWEYRRPDGERWIETAMAGSNTNAVQIDTTVSSDGYRYRCRISDAAGNVVYTQPATLRVFAFRSHPVETFATTGDQVIFTVTTTMDSGFTYRWQYSENGVDRWFSIGTNSASLTLSGTQARNGYWYRCLMICPDGTRIASKAANLHIADPVLIHSQTIALTRPEGAIATFKVDAENVSTYQWQYCRPGSNTWINTAADGNTTNILQIPVVAHRDGYRYRCMMVGINGRTYYTNVATLTVS